MYCEYNIDRYLEWNTTHAMSRKSHVLGSHTLAAAAAAALDTAAKEERAE